MKNLLPKIILSLLVIVSFFVLTPSALAQTASWQTPQNISNTQRRSFYPAMASDSQGKQHIAWLEYAATDTSSSVVLYSNNTGGGFSPPFEVANDGGRNNEPIVAIALQGNNAHILYYGRDETIRHAILTFQGSNVTKGSNSAISQSGQKSLAPSVAVDSTGGVHAVWIGKRGTTEQYQIYHRIWKNGSWEATSRMVNATGDYQNFPNLAATTDGIVHVIYRNANDLGYSTFSGGNWATGAVPGPITAKVNQAYLAKQGNTVHAVWSVSASQHEVYYAKRENNTWTSPILLSSSQWADQPSIVATEPTGSVFGLWSEGEGYTIRAREITSSGQLGETKTLSSANALWARGSSGTTPYIAWSAPSGSEDILLSSTQLAQAPEDPPAEESGWVPDPEVTFVGKTAARSSDFLDWALEKYTWMEVADGQPNPLSVFWVTIRNIVYATFVLFVLITAFIVIITHGKSLSAKRFIPRFLGVILLVTLSFAIIQVIYQVTDITQGFFLRSPDDPTKTISSKHLLYIGFDYKSFTGFRLSGSEFEESAFITLLLTKATAVTYYVMTSILIIRKIILWLFIVISPVFPLLLLYYPIRNTAKLWIGEFFRWLLYAPLFSLLLGGLVSVWRIGIPLPFNFTESGFVPGQDKVYETSVNILLGGPGQAIGIDNSVNLPSTFALYVVALIMLWVVTILPFILLQIFLNYFNSYAFSESTWIKQLALRGSFRGKYPPSFPPTAPVPAMPSSTGMARSIPTTTATNTISNNTYQTNAVRSSTESSWQTSTPVRQSLSTFSNRPIQTSNDILKLSNLTLPTMRDIAKFEIGSQSTNTIMQTDVTRMRESLTHIANPSLVSSPVERNKYTAVKQTLVAQSHSSPLAASLLSAVNSLDGQMSSLNKEVVSMKRLLERLQNPAAVTRPVEREQYRQMKETLIAENQRGNTLAGTILQSAGSQVPDDQVKKLKQELSDAKDKNNVLAHSLSALLSQVDREVASESQQNNGFPVVNRVQSVSLDDYEAVKKMWMENYRSMADEESTLGSASHDVKIKNDMEEIARTVNLLTSTEPEKVAEGMQTVANILPFLLLGGFSQTEIIAYLKAKLEAAKTVLEELQKKQENEDTLLSMKQQAKPQEMHMEQSIAQPVNLPEDGKLKIES